MEGIKLKSKDVGCPSCGATMKYSPAHKKLRCDNCQTCKDVKFEKVQEKHAWEDRNKATASTKEWAKQTKKLKCPNCGASVSLGALEYSKTCPYCETNLVADDINNDVIAPDGIIPFELSDEQASILYVKGVKKKFFAPRAFKKAPPTDNIKGIYIPSFSYDANTKSKYSGTLSKTVTSGVGENRRSYTSYRHIKGDHSANLVDVIVETSSQVDQVLMREILPYDMTKAVEFNNGFIMGYTVEQYQNTTDECLVIAKREMQDIIKWQILAKYNYDKIEKFELTTEYSNLKYLYYLLPIYKCNYKYKEKTYNTYMNGQTGKIGGKYPISGLKVFFVVMIALLFLGGIVAIALLS